MIFTNCGITVSPHLSLSLLSIFFFFFPSSMFFLPLYFPHYSFLPPSMLFLPLSPPLPHSSLSTSLPLPALVVCELILLLSCADRSARLLPWRAGHGVPGLEDGRGENWNKNRLAHMLWGFPGTSMLVSLAAHPLDMWQEPELCSLYSLSQQLWLCVTVAWTL